MQSNGVRQCFLSNSLSQSTQYGSVTSCVKVTENDISYSVGSAWSNAVYSLTPLPTLGLQIHIK